MRRWGTATCVHLIVATLVKRARARARGPLKYRLQVCGDHSLRGETCGAARIPRVIIHHATMESEFSSFARITGATAAGYPAFRFDLQVEPMDPIALVGISPRRLNALDPRYRIESFDFTTCAVSFDASRARAHNDSILIRSELVSLLATRTLAEFRCVSDRSISHTERRSDRDKRCE